MGTHGVFGAGTSKPAVVLDEVVPEVAVGAVALHAADLVALKHVVLHGVVAVHGGDRLVRALIVCRMSRVTALSPLPAHLIINGDWSCMVVIKEEWAD